MTRSPAAAPERTPTVLVVLVARDAAGWLRGTVAALAAQDYPRLAVLGVDDGSGDETRDILEQALGERRVIALDAPLGRAAAFRAAMDQPAASEADFVLLLQDGAALDPDAVRRLVEAAVGLPGISRVGVVGGKVVDREHPRALVDVGRSSDIFGHAYSPLQAGEIDQGQFDRVLEVLCVSTSALLIARDAWKRSGLLDERLDDAHQGLDLCWRARLAGFRVLMTPLARVRSRVEPPARTVSARGRRHGPRFEEDRAAIATMIKNYGVISLLWVVPLAVLQGLVRLLYLTLSRRFEEAYDVLGAWGWNVAHLGGTWSRRRRIQRERAVKDRHLRRFMQTAGLRLPRWFQNAERILEEQRAIDQADEDETATRRFRDRTVSLVGSHPVVVGSFLAVLVGAVAIRGLFGPEPLVGGVIPAFPDRPDGFVSELVSAYRTTVLGGPLSASPALGALGGLSWLTLGSTALAQKALLVAGPAFAAILSYRAAVRSTGRPGPSVLAAAAYVVSGLVLWAFSEGDLALLVALAVLPAAFERAEVAFSGGEPTDGRWRFVAGYGVTIAVLVAFMPSAVLAVLLLVVVQAIGGSSRGRGLSLVASASAVAAVLVFPFVPTLVAGGGAALAGYVGTTDLSSLVRLAPGGGPGTWVVAAFLPVAAFLSFALVGAEHRARAVRAAVTAAAALGMSWLAAAGWLPGPLSDPLAYLALAAASEAMLVAYGVSSTVTGLGREAFGLRHVLTGLLAVTLGGGIFLQTVAVLVGGWAVGEPGPDRVPPAWSVVESRARGQFRVLWLGAGRLGPFPPPGGEPQAVAEAGRATVRYALTDREGVSALDLGRPSTGPGPEWLAAALDEILSGTTRHGGALLAPFGVRFVVAGADDLPDETRALFDTQVDLDPTPAAELVVYRNAAAMPPAAILDDDPATVQAMRAVDMGGIARSEVRRARPIAQVQGGWEGGKGAGPVFLSTEFQGAWELEGTSDEPFTAFGWATGFPAQRAPVSVRYGAQLPATVQAWLLAGLWVVALWVTRKPVAR
jgi:glycosyltransferase involved in cell wall biosynthesis